MARISHNINSFVLQIHLASKVEKIENWNLKCKFCTVSLTTEKQKALAALASQVSLFSKEAGVISLPSTASIVAWSLPASASGTAAIQVIGVP
jgi:hypothetical protein